MQRSLELIRRWRALDKDLFQGVLRLSEFAEIWMVDRKTIRRDLALFKKMGYPAICEARRSGVDYVWRYDFDKLPKGYPMFVATVDDSL